VIEDGEEDENYNRMHTHRRGCGCRQCSMDVMGTVFVFSTCLFSYNMDCVDEFLMKF